MLSHTEKTVSFGLFKTVSLQHKIVLNVTLEGNSSSITCHSTIYAIKNNDYYIVSSNSWYDGSGLVYNCWE